ncbi:hypothetical protein WJX73_010092 [Symbiochloris irregularis]|uniref:Uncharacterized protein n=1 Tax=Symbiochloris irregularis TaxID=706552 RepID=A0AAW1P290_9CHLO
MVSAASLCSSRRLAACAPYLRPNTNKLGGPPLLLQQITSWVVLLHCTTTLGLLIAPAPPSGISGSSHEES